MRVVKSYSFEPKYRRDNGLIVLDIDKLPLPKDFEIRETSIVQLPANQTAGNHQHPRQEAYLCLDTNVELHWIDEAGHPHAETMAKAGGNPELFVIPPFLPHAVVNKSEKDVTLLGYADGPLESVESMEVAALEHGNDADISEPESSHIAKLLSKLEPGFLPFDIFHQITRLVVTPIVEVVPLRRLPNGKVEILLLKREADDPVWSGQLHVPGTVVRASDAPGSFDDPLNRVLSKELVGVRVSRATFVGNILHHSGRGMEASQVFWVKVEGEPAAGQFYDVNHLPKSIVKSQLDFIPQTIAHFKNTSS